MVAFPYTLVYTFSAFPYTLYSKRSGPLLTRYYIRSGPRAHASARGKDTGIGPGKKKNDDEREGGGIERKREFEFELIFVVRRLQIRQDISFGLAVHINNRNITEVQQNNIRVTMNFQSMHVNTIISKNKT